MAGLSKLIKLTLDENQLQYVPASFCEFKSLTDLSIAKNKLTEVRDDAFKSLANLTMLDL